MVAFAQVIDFRKNQEVYTLMGHTDTPTSLSLSPNGSYLLSPSFSSSGLLRLLRGHPDLFNTTSTLPSHDDAATQWGLASPLESPNGSPFGGPSAVSKPKGASQDV